MQNRLNLKHFCIVGMLVSCVTGVSCLMAKPEGLSRYCTNGAVAYSRGNVVLGAALNETKKAPEDYKVFLFSSTASSPFYVNHVNPHPSASAGWGSKLSSGRVSVIKLMKGRLPFMMNCTKATPKGVKSLDCKKVLRVCELKNRQLKKSEAGSYWIVEDARPDALQPFVGP